MSSRHEARAFGWARIGLGAIFLARTTPVIHALRPSFAADAFPLLGWPDGSWTVAWSGLTLPAAVVAALCIVRTLAAVLFMCGVRARTAGIVASISGYLVLAQDRYALVNSLHVLLLGTLVLSFTVAPNVLAIGPLEESPTTSSSVRFVGLVLAGIYFWAGVAKLQRGWLSGHSLDALARSGAFVGRLGPWLEGARGESMRAIATWTVPAIELALAGLFVMGARRIAVPLALAFHVAVQVTIDPDLIGWEMAMLLGAIAPWTSSVTERTSTA